jgi:hypothetical protein
MLNIVRDSVPKVKAPAPSADGQRNGTSIWTEAQRLYARGFWVAPCDGKRAVRKEWAKTRLTREELREALDGTSLNIGIVLNQSGLIDVECDSDEAEANLQAMFGGKIPPTPTWRSKRGRHRLFRRPADPPDKAKLDLDAVEFRGLSTTKGAYSIVPPSVHPDDGSRYEWLPGLSLFDLEPAELPPEVVERLRTPPRQPAAPSPTAGDGEIAEGKRNDTLFRAACSLRDLKLPDETILAALLDLNRRRCKPPLPEDEVRGIAKSVAKGVSKAGSFLARLLGEVELWHDESDEPFITLPQDGHKENWKIGTRSRPFRRWVSKRYYEATGGALTANVLADLATLLEGKAVFNGPRYTLFRRTAEHEGAFYLDLCDDEWRAVEIGPNGWRVVSDPPVKFRRAKAMQPLPVPQKSKYFLKRLLLRFLNVKEEQWPLVAAWLAAAIRPTGPYPLLKLTGEQGSAKTTTARVLRALIDPNAAPVRAEPREARDLMIAANNSWVLCLDNLSFIPPWLSDALCRVSTGGGFATRTLYTDEDETIFDSRRPVILTSIEEIGTRSDLLERSLIIELPTIGEGARRSEKALWAEFEEALPQILGALLDVVCGAMRRLPEVEGKPDATLSRMADFEQWGEAAEEALGLAPGTFAEAYAANREAATHVALESSPVLTALLKFLIKNPCVEYTASDLLDKLGLIDPESKRAPGWPKTPRVLSQILRRVAPNLRQAGIVVAQDTRGGGNAKEKVWRIEKTEPTEPERTARPTRRISDPCVPSDPARGGLAEHLRSRGGRVGRDAK